MREERDVGSYYYERERVRGGAPLCGDDLRERAGMESRRGEIWNSGMEQEAKGGQRDGTGTLTKS